MIKSKWQIYPAIMMTFASGTEGFVFMIILSQFLILSEALIYFIVALYLIAYLIGFWMCKYGIRSKQQRIVFFIFTVGNFVLMYLRIRAAMLTLDSPPVDFCQKFGNLTSFGILTVAAAIEFYRTSVRNPGNF